MTTIVLKDGIMAADGRVTNDLEMIVYDSEKKIFITDRIFNESGLLPMRFLIGLCGSSRLKIKCIDIIKNAYKNMSCGFSYVEFQKSLNISTSNEKDDVFSSLSSLIVCKAGKNFGYYIFSISGGFSITQREHHGYIAYGSGAEYAYGAMDAGASAEEAVRIACKRDPFSGGEIQVVDINKI